MEQGLVWQLIKYFQEAEPHLGKNRKILGLELPYDEDNGISVWMNN